MQMEGTLKDCRRDRLECLVLLTKHHPKVIGRLFGEEVRTTGYSLGTRLEILEVRMFSSKGGKVRWRNCVKVIRQAVVYEFPSCDKSVLWWPFLQKPVVVPARSILLYIPSVWSFCMRRIFLILPFWLWKFWNSHGAIADILIRMCSLFPSGEVVQFVAFSELLNRPCFSVFEWLLKVSRLSMWLLIPDYTRRSYILPPVSEIWYR